MNEYLLSSPITSTATLTESELFQHFLTSPMRGYNSKITNINAEAYHYTMIDVLPKSCESTLLDYDIADTFANALMTCEEDPDHEVKMIIWFLEELLDGMRIIRSEFEALKENVRANAPVQSTT